MNTSPRVRVLLLVEVENGQVVLKRRLDPDTDLLTRSTIAKLWNRSRQRISQIAVHPDFPAPFITINFTDDTRKGDLWLKDDVDRFRQEHPLFGD